jgi:hypothetical protein
MMLMPSPTLKGCARRTSWHSSNCGRLSNGRFAIQPSRKARVGLTATSSVSRVAAVNARAAAPCAPWRQGAPSTLSSETDASADVRSGYRMPSRSYPDGRRHITGAAKGIALEFQGETERVEWTQRVIIACGFPYSFPHPFPPRGLHPGLFCKGHP